MQVNRAKLKQLREQAGLSYADVSDHLDFKSMQAYYLKETGKRDITAVELGKLAGLYGVSTDDLLTEDAQTEQCANY